ncbi:IclR family transcriptional regulator [Geodermatophilus sp. YIM 151500]|uniref:IclR family transcriptional regulator n=1 Tax=Geodermatophilus sp. YIM 151500 TaxID=2984531 RepID=UPI0021E49DB7|nr:IclR family transcriptional regulator [Geodermatophilus sp. YIM 151500]MCV2490226.1 IclR family transcriptional regulator [Geodermatophilus sp. YIM 151500]
MRAGADGVQSLERAFLLLELMAEDGGEVALSRLAADSGLPLSTIHRLVRTLVARGYVRQLPSRRYVLGPRLIHLGESSSRTLGTWARPHLVSLVDTTGETANLAMLDGDRVVYVAQVPSRHSMRMFTEVGRRVHLHCTGVGKALLSQVPPGTARELVVRGGMPRRTPRTITDPDELLAELGVIADRGYALDDGEQETGVRCIAVPVPGGPAQTALSVSGPESRLPLESVPEIAAVLQATAADLAAELHDDRGGVLSGRSS